MRIFSCLKSLFVAMIMLMVISSATNVNAAALTAVTDRMSRQDVSQTSDHQIQFTTPTGVDTSSDTITVTFPAGFNLSSIGFGDIDLFHGAGTGFETTETLAAAPAAGVWGAGVSGQTLTLTAPTDAALGEITAGDKVIIRIGLNAVGGVNRITNPSGSGTYQVFIAGTFGDSGSVLVPILTPGTIAVSATVGSITPTSSGGGSGGGGGPGGVDAIPPNIFNVRVINITSNSAVVVWDTDEPSDSRVDYGYGLPYTNVVSSTGLVVSHSLSLTGLTPETLYHFRVSSKDAIGNNANTGDLTFETEPVSVLPIISNVRVLSITQDSAMIAWDTNVTSTSLVTYGLTNAYGSTASTAGTQRAHTVTIRGLTPNTLYHFQVQSSDAGGLTAMSGDFTFTTAPDTTPPTNVFGFNAVGVIRAINLSWSNPTDPDFSSTRIVARTDRSPSGPSDGRLVYQGPGTSAVDAGLTPGVRVFYGAYAFDSAGNNASGALADAVPLGELLPPPEPPIPTPTPTPTPPSGTGGTTTIPARPPVTPPSSGTTTTPIEPPPAGTATETQPIIPPPTRTTTTEPTGPSTPRAPTINTQFYGSQGRIELQVNQNGQLSGLANQSILVKIPVQGLASAPTRGTIKIGDSTYALTPLPGESGVWGASFVPSQRAGLIPAVVELSFPDETTSRRDNQIVVQTPKRITEGEGQDQKGISEVRIEVFSLEGNQERPYTLSSGNNRIVTDKDGYYGALVANGRYRLKIQKDGYDPIIREVAVSNNVLSEDIKLNRIQSIAAILDAIRTPEVQRAANIAVPVALVATLGVAATAVSAFNLLTYLYFLFSQPFLLLSRRKRRQWGSVYNALSKLPIELAVVRLMDANTKRVLQTRITDAKGRFTFFVKPGTYRIEVSKPGFKSPSEILKGEKMDIDHVDLYFGEPIEVKEETSLGVNIPVDPIVAEELPKKVILKKVFRRVQSFVGGFSVILSVIALIISPSWLMAGLALAQLVIYLLFRRLAIPAKPKQWGIVHEGTNKGRKLEAVVVRIFDKKFNKLLETQVTDRGGKYGFIVGKNEYFVTAAKDGFETYKSDSIDLTKQKEGVINQPISLKRK